MIKFLTGGWGGDSGEKSHKCLGARGKGVYYNKGPLKVIKHILATQNVRWVPAERIITELTAPAINNVASYKYTARPGFGNGDLGNQFYKSVYIRPLLFTF